MWISNEKFYDVHASLVANDPSEVREPTYCSVCMHTFKEILIMFSIYHPTGIEFSWDNKCACKS